MADIRPYTSQVLAQGARATPEDFGAPVAQAVGNLAGATMDVAQALHQQEVQDDVNEVQVQMANARAEWTRQLRDRANAAKPGDETFTPRLADDMKSYFGDLAKNVKTRRGQEVFNLMAANVQSDFIARGIATQSALAAEGAKLNVMKMQDASGQTVAADPTQRDAVLGQMATYINSLPGIDQATRASLLYNGQNYVNRAAVLGKIQRNPDELLARINPKDLEPGSDAKQLRTGDASFDALPADDQFKLVAQAREYSRAYAQDNERARIQAEREKKDAQQQIMDGFMQRIFSPQPGQGSPSAREVMADTTLDPTQKEHLILLNKRWQEEQLSGQNKPNPFMFRQLMGRIHAADDDPRKTYSDEPVLQAYMKGQINYSEFNALRNEVTQLKEGGAATGFIKDVKMFNDRAYRMLTRSIRGQARPEIAEDAAYRFQQYVNSEIARYRKEGKDPRPLITEGSRDYLGAPEKVMSFMGTAAQVLDQGAKAAVEAEKKQLPVVINEADYMKLPSGAQYQAPDGSIRTKK